MINVAALVPYHLDYCAGQRFRIETWARLLRPRGIEVSFLPFTRPELTDVLYDPGKSVRKAAEMLLCFGQQLARVSRHQRPDLVFIYREAALLGPAIIEPIVKRWGVPVIYDLDEPLFAPMRSPRNELMSVLKFPSKIGKLMEMSDRVQAVNKTIAMYAGNHARNVSIVPMAADTERYRPARARGNGPVRVGWVGTRTSQWNLETIAEPLARFGRTHGARLRVIADEPMTLPNVDLEFLRWGFDTEVAQLQECQIGIVPIKPHVWSPWKFYFKLVQLMSLGLPVVAAPIGSNLEIIDDGVNGFLASSPDEWYERLRALADSPGLRKAMGEAARATVEEGYSLAKQVDALEALWKSHLPGHPDVAAPPSPRPPAERPSADRDHRPTAVNAPPSPAE